MRLQMKNERRKPLRKIEEQRYELQSENECSATKYSPRKRANRK